MTPKRELTHDEVQASLAASLRHTGSRAPLVCVEVNLQSPYLHRHVGRVDVVTFAPSHTRFCVSIYECKASRSDLLADLNAGKWQKYLPFCNRLYFAAPRGVITVDDLPPGVGLKTLGDKGWGTTRQARPQPGMQFSQETLLTMLFCCGRGLQDQSTKTPEQRLSAFEHIDMRDKVRTFGHELGSRLANLERLEKRAEEAERYYSDALLELGCMVGMEDGGNFDAHSLYRAVTRQARSALGAGISGEDAAALNGIARYLQMLSNSKDAKRFRPRVPDRFDGWHEEEWAEDTSSEGAEKSADQGVLAV